MKKFKQKLLSLLGAFLVGTFSFLPKVQAQERVIRDPFPNPNSTELAIEHNYQELNPSGKTAYLEGMLSQDTSRIYIKKIPGAMCGNYFGQMWINSDGDSTLVPEEIPFDYYYIENGKGNIQTLEVGFGVLFHGDSLAHSTNAFVINDTLENISSLYIYDNSRGKRIYLDSLEKNIDLDYQIRTSVPVTISHVDGLGGGGFPHTEFMLRFKDINGVLTLTEKDPTVVLTSPKLDNEKPITEYSFTDTITNNPDNLILNYNFHDGEYLETSSWVFYNSSLNRFDTAYYDFYSGHFLDSGYFQIDNQDKNNFDFSQNKVPTNPNSTLLPIYNQSGEIPLDKSEGEHQVIVNITDYSGNHKKDTINYINDTTPPEITASINQIGETDSAEIAINVLEANPDYSRYFYNDSDWVYFTSDTLFREQLKQGDNILNVESRDKATNFSEEEVNYNFVSNAVEEKEEPKTLEDYFKAYPNPTNSIVNFEFNLDAPQNLRFSISDIAGRQLEQRVIKGNFGENKVSYDFSKYDSQICIYRIIGDKGYVKTGKVFKK